MNSVYLRLKNMNAFNYVDPFLFRENVTMLEESLCNKND